jgi:hypothetical protein
MNWGWDSEVESPKSAPADQGIGIPKEVERIWHITF